MVPLLRGCAIPNSLSLPTAAIFSSSHHSITTNNPFQPTQGDLLRDISLDNIEAKIGEVDRSRLKDRGVHDVRMDLPRGGHPGQKVRFTLTIVRAINPGLKDGALGDSVAFEVCLPYTRLVPCRVQPCLRTEVDSFRSF